MCGRYELHTPMEDIARRFDAHTTDEASALPPRYNIAPSLRVAVVRETTRGRFLEAMSWGLVPAWVKEVSRVRPINARAETLFDKPMFRAAIRRRRCLVPADGFYEWQAGPGRKQPFRIGMVDGAPFAMGGIWEYWARPGQQPLVSCAIVVTGANELVAAIHERMPVIIGPEDYARWLDPASMNQAQIEALLAPYPAELMRAQPVSTLVNDVNNDGPALVEPLTPSH